MNRIALAALALVAIAAPAAAETSGLAYNGNKSVKLTLQGDVSPRCGIVKAPGATLDLGDLRGRGGKTIDFTIDCNEPVAYTLTSRNGELRNVDLKGLRSPAGFADRVAYDVAVISEIGFGGDTRHESGDLAGAGQGRASTDVAFEQNLSLALSWDAAGDLMAGRYEDVLTLKINGGS